LSRFSPVVLLLEREKRCYDWSSYFVDITLAAQSLTTERQTAIGTQIADEVSRNTRPVESIEVQNYVAQLGAKIASRFVLPDASLKFTFSVVSTENDNSLHEPLVLPGGYIIVPSRLLLTASNEAEFAGMLAQAIARGLLPIQVAQNSGASIPVFTVIGNFMGDNALPGVAIGRQREAELQSDKFAVLAMSRVGFDPAALLRFIDRMQPPDTPRSPFPPHAARIAALREALRDVPPAAYAENDEFYTVQQRLRPAPPEPRSPPSLFAR
jgi:predicted Zn-dependent protease